ncbi:stage II sporulation protein M [Candidatus Woesearchaeota archaeon]|nr:stage II sporulation protein M [Candidatus Woesearchaeota archaeon]
MVLESLINPLKAEKKPWEMFFVGFLYTSIAILLSLWVFREQVSLMMVFLTVVASIPIIYNTLKLEEDKDLKISKEILLLKEHNKAITFLMLFFFGMTLSFVAWYVFLPSECQQEVQCPSVGVVFEKQIATIQAINNLVSGNASYQTSLFSKILFNNVKVLAFALLFALVYGAGYIFILAWNASIIGTAIGNFIRSNISQYASLIGFEKFSNYFNVISIGLFRYILHGVPEIIAYFYGGLAGGIISTAIIKKHYKNEKFPHIVLDISELLIISLAFLVIAAFIEVYITPALFQNL